MISCRKEGTRIIDCGQIMRIDVLGVGFDNMTAEQAVLHACEIINSGQKAYIVTPNPEIVWMARKNDMLRETVNAATLVLPDGIGVIMAALILGTPLKEKIDIVTDGLVA